MNIDKKENALPAIALTVQALEALKNRGFRYVRVNAFTRDKHQDYMEPYYILLEPIKDLSDGRENKGIFERVDSQILMDWAKSPDDGIKIFVAG